MGLNQSVPDKQTSGPNEFDLKTRAKAEAHIAKKEQAIAQAINFAAERKTREKAEVEKRSKEVPEARGIMSGVKFSRIDTKGGEENDDDDDGGDDEFQDALSDSLEFSCSDDKEEVQCKVKCGGGSTSSSSNQMVCLEDYHKGGMWQCVRCTFKNNSLMPSCEMCETNKPTRSNKINVALGGSSKPSVNRTVCVDTVDPSSAVYKFVKSEDPELSEALIKSGKIKDINVVLHVEDVYIAAIHNSAMHHSATNNLKYLLTRVPKPDINLRTRGGRTATILAVLSCRVENLEVLLNFSPDISIRDTNGMTAIDYARKNGFQNCIKLLERYQNSLSIVGSKAAGSNDDTLNTCMTACLSARLQKFMKEVHHDIIAFWEKCEKFTPLVLDSIKRTLSDLSESVVQTAKELSTKVKSNSQVFNFVFEASGPKDLDRMLTSKEITDVNMQYFCNDRWLGITTKECYQSAIHTYASDARKLDCLKYLLTYECEPGSKHRRVNVNQLDSFGHTPLVCAAIKGNSRALELLLDFDANRNILSSCGKTPLQLASDSRCVGILKEYNSNLLSRRISKVKCKDQVDEILNNRFNKQYIDEMYNEFEKKVQQETAMVTLEASSAVQKAEGDRIKDLARLEKERIEKQTSLALKEQQMEAARKIKAKEEATALELRLKREEVDRKRREEDVERKARALQLENERRARELFECPFCKLDKLLSSSIDCSSGKNHRICQECCWGDTKAQIDSNKFRLHAHKIVCSQCLYINKVLPYDDSLLMQVISRDKATLEVHQNALKEAVRRETERQAEKEKRAMILKHNQEMMEQQRDAKRKADEQVVYHSHRIFNDVIVTKCPNCELAFDEWEHCFAVEHTQVCTIGKNTTQQFGCGKYFCGWCFEKFDNTKLAHRHIIECPKNIRRPHAYGEPGDFKIHVEPEMRREKVAAYLASLKASGEVGPEVMEQLVQSIRKGLSEINVDVGSSPYGGSAMSKKSEAPATSKSTYAGGGRR